MPQTQPTTDTGLLIDLYPGPRKLTRPQIAALEDAKVIYRCDESHATLPEQPSLGVYHLKPGKDESSIWKVYLEAVSAPFPF